MSFYQAMYHSLGIEFIDTIIINNTDNYINILKYTLLSYYDVPLGIYRYFV